MKIHLFTLLTLLSLLMLAGCKDKNGMTNSPPPEPDPPVITEISPERGKSGTEVTITGSNFGAAPEENTVTFNGMEAVVTGAGETELTAEVPPEAGRGPVAVTVAGQTATGPEFTWFPDNTRFADGVNGSDQGGDNKCGDVEFPCRTLSHAIEVSFGGDILEIADAEYTESLTIDRPLTLRGESEAGTIIQAHEQPGQATDRVILIENVPEFVISKMTIRHGNGNSIAGGGVYMTNASGVFTNVTISGNSAAVGGGIYNTSDSLPTLTNVTISGNSAELGGGGGGGGGMVNVDSSPTLTNVTFSGNSTEDRGGGMLNINSSPTLTNVTFSENRAVVLAGGMRNNNSSPTLDNVVFTGNWAGDFGGGVDNTVGSTPTFTNVTFDGNRAGVLGGGMQNFRSSPILINVIFKGNEADYGGGMNNEATSSPTLVNVVFEDNMAARGGGGVHITDGSALLTNVIFSGNHADVWGGGMFVENASTVLTNVMFYSNESGRGGAMYNFTDSDVLLTNVTISGNSAALDGGGLRNTEGSSVKIVNSIMWGNISENGNGHQIASQDNSITELIYSLYGNAQGDIVEGDSFTATNSLTGNPQLINAANGNLRLAGNSPAINTGDPDTDLSIFATDENGNPIDLDGNPRVAGERIDIGAYENQEN